MFVDEEKPPLLTIEFVGWENLYNSFLAETLLNGYLVNAGVHQVEARSSGIAATHARNNLRDLIGKAIILEYRNIVIANLFLLPRA